MCHVLEMPFLLFLALAAETPKPGFGQVGTFVLRSDTQLFITGTAPLGGEVAFSGNVGADFAADYFFSGRWSFGLAAGVNYGFVPGQGNNQQATNAYTLTVGGGPAIGYYVPLGAWAGLWPRLELDIGAAFSGVDGQQNAGPTAKLVSLSGKAYAPVVFSPIEHFFFSVGILVDLVGLVRTVKGQPGNQDDLRTRITFGITSALGAWW